MNRDKESAIFVANLSFKAAFVGAVMTSHDHETQFVALLTDAQMPLRRYVQSLLPGDSSAPDVVQQANATLWKKRDDFILGTNFKAWAFSVARYEVLNFRKKQARDFRLVFSEEMEVIFAEDLAVIDEVLDERQEALKGCLLKLREVDRELLLHRYAATGTLQEYAERHGRSVGGVKVTLHRLRHVLLTCIERQLEITRAES